MNPVLMAPPGQTGIPHPAGMAKLNRQLLALDAGGVEAKLVASLYFARIRLGHGLNTYAIGSVASG
ncbi:hypothetical protein IB75_07985 [Nitrosococcus oceani C-27]|uniref:Uncharacterized protein n=1 Tax=Nitrosococcus oceani C-27 TaxID=314279 RepID=A0A0E2ZMF5_9GAMM|nr:hypothetical protein IB75_07985 [Nitrosococcus oceani C-27]